uniref:carboxypeptidase-like regulatory domain-containing protein n=1 Tax=Flavicella sp. TaxID=2957742 RepID=UPI003019E292
MKKLRQLNLKSFGNLLLIISFLLLGTHTRIYGANTINNQTIQNRTITGTVISSDDNMAIPGVNVILKGTSIGTITDFDGNYSINVSSSDAILVFSSIGFVS